jgi:hypothetical protein
MIGSVKKPTWAACRNWGKSANPPPEVVRHNFADLGFHWEVHDVYVESREAKLAGTRWTTSSSIVRCCHPPESDERFEEEYLCVIRLMGSSFPQAKVMMGRMARIDLPRKP